MWPQSLNRGRDKNHSDQLRAEALQCGRGLLTAEGRRAAAPTFTILPASMWPRSVNRGRALSEHLIPVSCTGSSQWARTRTRPFFQSLAMSEKMTVLPSPVANTVRTLGERCSSSVVAAHDSI